MSYIERTDAEMSLDRKRHVYGAILQHRANITAADAAPVVGTWFAIPRWARSLMIEAYAEASNATSYNLRWAVEGRFGEDTESFTLYRPVDLTIVPAEPVRNLFRANLSETTGSATLGLLPLTGTQGTPYHFATIPREIRAATRVLTLTGTGASTTVYFRAYWR